MCEPATIMATTALVATAAGGIMSAIGKRQEGYAQAQIYDYRGALSQQQASITQAYATQQKNAIETTAAANVSAIQASAAEESKLQARGVAELTGQQKATIGALGISGSVTAADILTSSFDKSTLDRLAIRHNANLRSWQVKEQAKRQTWTLGEETKHKVFSLGAETEQYRLASRQAKKAGNIGMATSILQTAGQTAYRGYKMV